MEDIGCRWTVWGGHGNTPGLAGKGVAYREDGHPRRNDRASVSSGSARSLIETGQPYSQPVGRRPVNHSRLKDRFDKVTGTRPAGSSFLADPPPGLWQVVGTRAQSRRVSGRGGTFHSRPRVPLPPLDSRVCGESGQGAMVRTAASRDLCAAGRRLQTRSWFRQPASPTTTARGFAL